MRGETADETPMGLVDLPSARRVARWIHESRSARDPNLDRKLSPDDELQFVAFLAVALGVLIFGPWARTILRRADSGSEGSRDDAQRG
jgi:hypothetical protein